MATYSEELLNSIRLDRKNGLTYKEITLKHGLKSNNAIKIALGKTTGGDRKYRGRHKARFHELLETEKKYLALLNVVKRIKKHLAMCGEELEDF